MTINELVKESFDCAVAHGWHDEPRSFGDLIALIHSEISEALEESRKYDPAKVYYVDGKPEGSFVELADCCIRIFDACGRYGIDLENLLKIKMAYNKTRPYRHGNKKL